MDQPRENAGKELSRSESITLGKTAQRCCQRSIDGLTWRLRRWL